MEQLETIYQNQFKLYELLNTFAINGNKLRKQYFFLDLIKQFYLCDDDADAEAIEILKEVDSFFIKKINYVCELEDDTISSTFLQENCELCNKKIENHEYFILYKFDKEEALSDFNTNLLEKFFSAESIPVVKDLKSNFSNVIPFVGAGISKGVSAK